MLPPDGEIRAERQRRELGPEVSVRANREARLALDERAGLAEVHQPNPVPQLEADRFPGLNDGAR